MIVGFVLLSFALVKKEANSTGMPIVTNFSSAKVPFLLSDKKVCHLVQIGLLVFLIRTFEMSASFPL